MPPLRRASDRLVVGADHRTEGHAMTPPVKLATDGTSLKHPHPGNSEWRFQRVDQRVLRGGDHLIPEVLSAGGRPEREAVANPATPLEL